MHRRPVWETTTVFTIAVGDGHAELTEEVAIEGILKDLVIVVGAAAGITGTVSVDFDDNHDVEFDSNAGLAEGSETIPANIDKPVRNFKIRVDPSAEPIGAGETWVITVYAKGI